MNNEQEIENLKHKLSDECALTHRLRCAADEFLSLWWDKKLDGKTIAAGKRLGDIVAEAKARPYEVMEYASNKESGGKEQHNGDTERISGRGLATANRNV